MASSQPKALIEISSEAGRKVGGIYTVLRSKAPVLHKKLGDSYLLISMLDEKCSEDVKFIDPPPTLKKIFDELANDGVHCMYGKWIYGDNTNVICVSAKSMGERLIEYNEGGTAKRDSGANYVKYLLWKNYGIDSLMEKSWDYTENVVWGGGVGMLLEKLFAAGVYPKNGTVLQFHEWITGAALLYCKMRNLNVPTVFTIHATVLGRTLSSAGIDVFSEAQKAKEPISLNVAYNNRVEGKHQLELAAAKEATVFTAVSDTVAQEAAYILGRKPDVVTFNGIDYSKAKWKDKQDKVKHDLSQYARNELLQFIEACFVSYYTQRYDDALLIYISGRYEFNNKGFDIFMKGVGKLNDRLKKKKNNRKRVFAFIFAPTAVKGPKVSIIKNYLLLDKISEVLGEYPETKDKPYVNLQASMSLLSGEKKADIENMAKGFVKDGPVPHINCYDLAYTGDAIIKSCVDVGLDNQEDDVVKVIFYPTYSKPNDGLMNLNYYDVISAMGIGIFPSRYEPFGYTPVEAATEMSMAVTSDMSGFGKFMLKVTKGKTDGVTVLHMAGKSADAAADELADRLEQIYYMPQKKIDAEKTSAYKMMALLDWNILIKNYYKAYELALAGKKEKKQQAK